MESNNESRNHLHGFVHGMEYVDAVRNHASEWKEANGAYPPRCKNSSGAKGKFGTQETHLISVTPEVTHLDRMRLSVTSGVLHESTSSQSATDSIMSMELWIALITGGAATKLIDYIIPSFINRKKRRLEFGNDERENLRRDIEYLREQLQELRGEVKKLREEVNKRDAEVREWQHKYYEVKIQLDRVLIQVKHHGSPEVKQKVKDALREDE
jgi:predicted nuclease with TOPRIM domain